MVLMMNRLISRYPLYFQIFRFGVVGVTAAAMNFCIVVLMVELKLLTPLVANVFGFIIAVQLSYWGHRLWTFSGTDALHKVAFPKLLSVQILNLIASEGLLYIFLMLKIPYQIALLIILTILPIFTFIANKLWVFR